MMDREPCRADHRQFGMPLDPMAMSCTQRGILGKAVGNHVAKSFVFGFEQMCRHRIAELPTDIEDRDVGQPIVSDGVGPRMPDDRVRPKIRDVCERWKLDRDRILRPLDSSSRQAQSFAHHMSAGQNQAAMHQTSRPDRTSGPHDPHNS